MRVRSKNIVRRATLADAIMDRLIHRSHKIHLQGKESMRRRAGKETAKD